jgi:hypothetical protein
MKSSSPVLEFLHTSIFISNTQKKNLSFKAYALVQPQSLIVTSNRCIKSVAFELTYFFGRLSEALEIQDKTIDLRGPCCEV